jgi:hypothetical protein
VQLVHHGKGRVPALQRSRLSGQRRQRGVGVWDVDAVLKDLYPFSEPLVEFDYAPARVEHMPRPALIRCHGQHLGAFHLIGEQPIQRQH